jgi:hypothetical protein
MDERPIEHAWGSRVWTGTRRAMLAGTEAHPTALAAFGKNGAVSGESRAAKTDNRQTQCFDPLRSHPG